MEGLVKVGRIFDVNNGILCPVNGLTQCRQDSCAKFMTMWYYCTHVCEKINESASYCKDECPIFAYKNDKDSGFCTL